jgi:hypothetical protein
LSSLELLTAKKHQSLRVKTGFSADFGDNVMAAVTFPEEFIALNANFPIVFREADDESEDDFLCLALMGVETDENLFLDQDGASEPQFPLTMRIRPFIVGADPEDEVTGSVLIDSQSNRLTNNESEGQALFQSNGEYTDFLKGRIRQLELCYQGRQKGRGFIQMLRDYDLLESLQADLNFCDGTIKTLTGFYGINIERMNELPAKALKRMNDKGYLMPCFLSIASLTRIGDLVDRKNARIRAQK